MEDEKWICEMCNEINHVAASWCFWCGLWNGKKNEKKDEIEPDFGCPPDHIELEGNGKTAQKKTGKGEIE